MLLRFAPVARDVLGEDVPQNVDSAVLLVNLLDERVDFLAEERELSLRRVDAACVARDALF